MNMIKRLFWIFTTVAIISVYGCSSDDETFTQEDLIGIWTITGANAEFLVGEVSLVDYLIAELDLSETEASNFDAEMSAGMADGFDGTVEFKADNTYVAEFGDDPAETGTWELLDGGKKLKLLETGEDTPNEFDIISLSATTMVIEFEEHSSEELEGSELELTIRIEMTLQKQ